MPLNAASLDPIRSYLEKAWKGASIRERLLVAGLLLICGAFIANTAYSSIADAFDEQAKTMKDLQTKANAVGTTLAQYQTLKLRRDKIEDDFRKSEIPEGVSTYLESLVKSRLGSDSIGLEINDSPPAPISTRFEETRYSLKLTTSKFDKLVSLLEAVGAGDKPLAIKRIEMRKSPRGDSLRLELDVSAIRELKNKAK